MGSQISILSFVGSEHLSKKDVLFFIWIDIRLRLVSNFDVRSVMAKFIKRKSYLPHLRSIEFITLNTAQVRPQVF